MSLAFADEIGRVTAEGLQHAFVGAEDATFGRQLHQATASGDSLHAGGHFHRRQFSLVISLAIWMILTGLFSVSSTGI